jgi:flagellar biosynthesis chaperone FliJ
VILQSEREVTNTRVKLARLEARYEALRNQTNGDERVRELSMISLKRLINQLKEEIARYEAHQPLRRKVAR